MKLSCVSTFKIDHGANDLIYTIVLLFLFFIKNNTLIKKSIIVMNIVTIFVF